MCKLFGIGKRRALQGEGGFAVLVQLVAALTCALANRSLQSSRAGHSAEYSTAAQTPFPKMPYFPGLLEPPAICKDVGGSLLSPLPLPAARSTLLSSRDRSVGGPESLAAFGSQRLAFLRIS